MHTYVYQPSECAVVDYVVLSTGPGSAAPPCTTCSTCSAVVRLEWDCDGSCGCSYSWENHSSDKNGNPLPPQIGVGTGDGWARQLLITDCSLQEAEFGVSVGGALRVMHLQCGCQ